MGWGGGGCAPCPPTVRPGGPVGRRVALPRSVPLPSLGGHQSGCPWRRSGNGGRGPHTTPVRARLLSPGAVRAAPWRVGAGSLVLRGSCGNRRLGRGGGPCSGLPLGRRGPDRGRADHPLCLERGGDWRPRGLLAGGGGGGTRGGGRAVAPLLSLGGGGGRPAAPYPAPLSSPAHPPLAYAFGRGRGAAPCAGFGLPPAGQPGGGRGGAAREPPPRTLRQTRPVPLPSPSGQHCERHWRCSGHGRRGPHTAPFRRRVPPPGVARASFWLAGAGSPAGCDPRGSRRWGARGRAACGSSCVHPRASQSLLGEGGRPLGPGMGGGPEPPRPAGRGGSEGEWGGEGGARRCSPPPYPVGWPVAPVHVTLRLWRAPLGYTRAVRVAGRQWAPGAARSAAGGSVWRGGGGGRGLLDLVRSPAFPRLAPEWAASFAHSWVPPFRCRSAAGNAGVRWRSTGGAWRAAALAAAVVSPPPRVQRPLRGGAGPLSLRPASVRPWAGGGGGSPGPLTPPPDGRGGVAWWFWPRGASCRLGGRNLPLPPYTLWVPDPRAGPRSGPLLPLPSPHGWLGGGGGR